MIKNIKRTLAGPILFVLGLVVWTLWSVIESANSIMEYVERIGDKLFNWAQK